MAIGHGDFISRQMQERVQEMNKHGLYKSTYLFPNLVANTAVVGQAEDLDLVFFIGTGFQLFPEFVGEASFCIVAVYDGGVEQTREMLAHRREMSAVRQPTVERARYYLLLHRIAEQLQRISKIIWTQVKYKIWYQKLSVAQTNISLFYKHSLFFVYRVTNIQSFS